MTTSTEARTRLVQNDYVPIPCNGKAPVLKEWQKRTATSAGDIDIWAKIYPHATNTGILCTHCPTLDIDILDPDAVDAAVRLVHERFEGRGRVMQRFGLRPKVAIPFRTDTPFAKIKVLLTAPDGSAGQKIELLAEGQQVVVHGKHPDTHAPYQWLDGTPGSVKRDELPLITEAEAQTLVNDVVALMLEHGYQVSNERKRNGNGADQDNTTDDNTRADCGYLITNILAGHDLHDSLRNLGFNWVANGMAPGAVVNELRGLMERSAAPHDEERWQPRYDDIPRLVDGAVKLLRQTKEKKSPPPPAGEQPVPNGAAVLGLARNYLKKYVSHPSSHALVAHTLLCAHTHLLEAFDSTPRGAFLSAFPESGKTRALEATGPLVCRLVSTVNASANYLFRKAGDDAGPPTVLFDEIDTIFGPKAKEHEDIRGFINAGHRKGATYGRCRVVGNSVLTEDSPCFAAVMMAGLGWLPDTLLSRSVIIRMHRRLKSEKVAQFRGRTSIPEGEKIGAQLAAWARSVFGDAETARPEMPDGVEDRQADAWEPLLAVADLAGGEWPELAREAAVALVKVNRETPPSLKLRLLQDSRLVFFQNLQEAARARPKGLLTEMVLSELHDLEDAPWKTINKGEPFTTVELRNRFFDYGVEPEQLRPYPGDNHTQRRGYPLGPFALAWRRYLPPLCLRLEAVTAVTGVTRKALDEYFDWVLVDDDGKPVTDVTGVTGFSGSERDQGETGATGVTGFSPRERDQEAEATPATDATPDQETAAVPDSGAPNIAKILDQPFDPSSPFNIKPRNRR
jgi:hypothetical protein